MAVSRSDMLGIEVLRGQVLPAWIDINDHMNVAYYVLAFDQAVDSLWHRFGLTDEHVRENRSSTFAVESHITWQREMSRSDSYIVTSQILAFDEKRIHQFMRMYHAGEGHLVATAEWMNLHVDLVVRRVAPWPDDILGNIASYFEEQGERPWPAEAGRRMCIDIPIRTAASDAT